MAITAQDIKKLRDLTNAGMMDCKKALTEANGDFDRARDILRERGQVIAAKRSEREATDGVALARIAPDGKFGAAIILNSETDFVAENDKFQTLANQILDVAIAQRPADLDALKALTIDGITIADKVSELTGIIGEKIDLSAYKTISAESLGIYIHNKKIAAVAGFSKAGVDANVGKQICMQIATMSPVAVSRDVVPQATIDNELSVAIEKTKEELVNKQVDAALNKVGINPAHVDSEEHIESNQSKGWITAEQAAKAREIKATVGAEAAKNINDGMVQNIAKGRLNKFFKENTLMEQEFVMGDGKQTVEQFLKTVDKDIKVSGYIRLGLAN